MLVLAIDTSTPAVTAGVVSISTEPGSTEQVSTLSVRVTVNPRAHAEVLTPQILECLAESGHVASDLDAVVVGAGPGPFTGLRVGMATAAAFGDALGIPVHGVCSLDAIAAAVSGSRNLLVVTDARRREVYWARYSDGARIEGPSVVKPAELEPTPSDVIAGSASHVDLFDLPVEPAETPSPEGLVEVAVSALLEGRDPDPLVPLYLRRPDAVELVNRKK